MGVDQFDGGDFLLTDLLRHDNGGKKSEISHARVGHSGQKGESSMGTKDFNLDFRF
jgi:hypothetical protein